jgi:CO/xanthine dehydrogenase FAD-binding subunit
MANATPSADVAPALLVVNAKVKISRSDGEKIVLMEEFFVGCPINVDYVNLASGYSGYRPGARSSRTRLTTTLGRK